MLQLSQSPTVPIYHALLAEVLVRAVSSNPDEEAFLGEMAAAAAVAEVLDGVTFLAVEDVMALQALLPQGTTIRGIRAEVKKVAEDAVRARMLAAQEAQAKMAADAARKAAGIEVDSTTVAAPVQLSGPVRSDLVNMGKAPEPQNTGKA